MFYRQIGRSSLSNRAFGPRSRLDLRSKKLYILAKEGELLVKRREKLLWIGLSGGIACGKSTVARLLEQQGFVVLDADQMTHLCLQEPQIQKRLREIFGEEIFVDGQIDRPALGRRVFGQPERLSQLEGVLHPCVRQRIESERRRLQLAGEPQLVYDVPLLFEKSLQGEFDLTVCVSCRPDQQLERLMLRNGLSKDEALARIAAQMPLSQKEKLATFVIHNSADFSSLQKKVDELILRIKNETNV